MLTFLEREQYYRATVSTLETHDWTTTTLHGRIGRENRAVGSRNRSFRLANRFARFSRKLKGELRSKNHQHSSPKPWGDRCGQYGGSQSVFDRRDDNNGCTWPFGTYSSNDSRLVWKFNVLRTPRLPDILKQSSKIKLAGDRSTERVHDEQSWALQRQEDSQQIHAVGSRHFVRRYSQTGKKHDNRFRYNLVDRR